MKQKIDFDYKNFSFKKLFTKEYSYLFLPLYWICYVIFYILTENVFVADKYYPVYSPLDDLIPFCELFVIPYVSWYAYLFFMHLYTLIFDTETFKSLMKYIIITFSLCFVIYLVFPNCQELRPEIFQRNNLLTDLVASLYRVDTNTNVCPSMHVLGSLGLMFAAIHSKAISLPIKIGLSFWSVMIVLSTMFIKQHSIVDTFVAIPIAAVVYYLCFLRKTKVKKAKCKV